MNNKHRQTCLLLHGWGVNHQLWNGLTERISGFDQIKAPCLYQVANETVDNKIKSMALVLKEKVDADTIIIAWSLGGLIAMLLADLSNKIKGIVFIASSPCFVNKQEWENVLDSDLIEKLKQQLLNKPKQTISSFASLIAHGEPEPKPIIRKLQQGIAVENDSAILADWLGELLAQDLRSEFSKLTIPTLHILAENDALIRPQIEKQLKRLQPESNCMLINDSGHAPFISQPESIAKIINEFVNERNK